MAGWEGFLPPARAPDRWLGERGIELDADAVVRAAGRVATLVVDDGEAEADLAEPIDAERRYRAEPGVRAGSEDRGRGSPKGSPTAVAAGTASSAAAAGFSSGGVLLTAAHCVDGMVDNPERVAASVEA